MIDWLIDCDVNWLHSFVIYIVHFILFIPFINQFIDRWFIGFNLWSHSKMAFGTSISINDCTYHTIEQPTINQSLMKHHSRSMCFYRSLQAEGSFIHSVKTPNWTSRLLFSWSLIDTSLKHSFNRKFNCQSMIVLSHTWHVHSSLDHLDTKTFWGVCAILFAVLIPPIGVLM